MISLAKMLPSWLLAVAALANGPGTTLANPMAPNPLTAASNTPVLTTVPAFTIIGYAVRTSMASEMSGKDSKIGPLWNAFMHGGAAKIPGVTEANTIIAAYTKYSSDETGEYDTVLGKPVKPAEKAPAGMRRLDIPAARYRVFTAGGSSPDDIRNIWASIYGYFKQHPNEHRAFTTDFEQYQGSAAPKIFIAVR